jgi:cold shock CspA family protein/ribosome-associated translation inhibitor RaiA
MQIPLQITFRGVSHSDAVEAAIREKAAKLDEFFPRLVSCRVMVEASHHRHHQGNLYHIRIELGVPNKQLVVSREQHDNHAREDAYVVIRDAFDAAKRQLEEYARSIRGELKTHEAPPHGKVIRLVPDRDHGYIETPDGREIYFHRNSVTNGGFDKMEPGSEVRFTEVAGEEGPRASTVYLIGKHHIVE